MRKERAECRELELSIDALLGTEGVKRPVYSPFPIGKLVITYVQDLAIITG